MCTRDRWYPRLKRCLDVVGAFTGLVALSPVLIATAVLVAIKLGRPVIFRQVRTGRGGRAFRIIKFRSMLPVDEAAGRVDDADRLTRFGRILRSTSLDELPGLLNVLRGDMSIIGPRPLPVVYLPRYSAEQARRHDVRPGITGLAQVRGRNRLGWTERLEADVEYVDGLTLRADAAILARTVSVVVRREGVQAPGHVTMTEFLGA